MGISDIIVKPGLINVDFADVRCVRALYVLQFSRSSRTFYIFCLALLVRQVIGSRSPKLQVKCFGVRVVYYHAVGAAVPRPRQRWNGGILWNMTSILVFSAILPSARGKLSLSMYYHPPLQCTVLCTVVGHSAAGSARQQ